MAILMDNIIPSIIIGVLITMIFRLNSFMIETQVDNHLVAEMQQFSELAASIVHEELKTANRVLDMTENSIEFEDLNGLLVRLEREDDLLVVTKTDPATSNTELSTYPTYLASIQFTPDPEGISIEDMRFLRFRLMSESRPDSHARVNNSQTAKAFSEKQIFLRNVASATVQL